MLRQHSLTSLSTELPENYVGVEVPTAVTTESSTSETVHNYGRMETIFFHPMHHNVLNSNASENSRQWFTKCGNPWASVEPCFVT
jgi:hypothetical protein